MSPIENILNIVDYLSIKDGDNLVNLIKLKDNELDIYKKYKDNRSASKIVSFMRRLTKRIKYVKNMDETDDRIYLKWSYIIGYDIASCISFYYDNRIDWRVSILNKYEREKLNDRDNFTRSDFIKLIRRMDNFDLWTLGF